MAQEMIEVQIAGKQPYVVPKASEPYIRKIYYGTDDEKRLIIRAYPYKTPKDKRDKIVKKLKST